MKTFYFLSTCDTCKRIIKLLNIKNDVVMREIKSNPISEKEVDRLAQKAGSHESIFNKRARKYQSLNSENKPNTEDDYRQLLLSDYTFLKRPLLETQTRVIAGNSRTAIEEMAKALEK